MRALTYSQLKELNHEELARENSVLIANAIRLLNEWPGDRGIESVCIQHISC